LETNGRAVLGGCVAIERLVTSGRVFEAGGEAKERIITLSRVTAGIASVRCWGNRLRWRRQREASKRERDEKESEPQRRTVNRSG